MLGCLALGAPAAAAPPEAPETPSNAAEETGILARLRTLNGAETEAARLAQGSALSPRVRDYAIQLLRDQRLAEQAVEGFAQSHGLELPEPEPTAEEAGELERLRGSRGPAFDHAFLAAMIADHERAIAELGAAEARAPDLALRRLLRRLIPILRQQLELGQHLEAEIGESG